MCVAVYCCGALLPAVVLLGSSATLQPLMSARLRVLFLPILVSGWKSTCMFFTFSEVVNFSTDSAGVVLIPNLKVPKRSIFTLCVAPSRQPGR